MNDTALLRVRDLVVRYGGVDAVKGVDIDLPAGQVVGLIGPNGAGKTTLVDAISGYTPYSGAVELAGRSLDGAKAHERARAGLARTFQALELFDDLTVYENVRAAAALGRLRSIIPGSDWYSRSRRDIKTALAAIGLEGVSDVRVSELPQGSRKLVALARAFVSSPRIALLDEPFAGLDSRESESLGERVGQLVHEENGVLIIDHDIGMILRMCNMIYVIDFGKLIAFGPPDEIRNDPRVISAYLGSDIEDATVEARR